MPENGLVHLYTGDGKGKTTAAVGLCVRALGRGLRVVFVQFLKNGQSGELAPLRSLGADVLSGGVETFVGKMSAEERREARARMNELLTEALRRPSDLLVLDEACVAAALEMADEALLRKAVEERPAGREIVLTGRGALPWMLEAADYVTVMKAEKHPFERGLGAREGIEY